MNHVLFRAPGDFHAVIEVIQCDDTRYLRFGEGGGWQGALRLHDPHRLVFPYQRAFQTLVRALPHDAVKTFLALGVGSGTALRTVHERFPQVACTGVDIDARVIEVAQRFFGSPDCTYIAQDAVSFLARPGTRYDLIFADIYVKDRIYGPAMAPEFAEVLRHRIRPGGTVASNVIFRPHAPGPVREFLQALQEWFAVTLLLPVGMPWTEQNVLVVATDRQELGERWKSSLSKSAGLPLWERMTWPLRMRRYQTRAVL